MTKTALDAHKIIEEETKWLMNNDMCVYALDINTELRVQLLKAVYDFKPKSSYAAKKDCDWDTIQFKITELARMLKQVSPRWQECAIDRFFTEMTND